VAQFEVVYYTSPAGAQPIEEFLAELPVKARAKCLSYIQLFIDQGFGLPRAILAKVEGKIWELRPEYNGIEYRILFTFISPQAIMVHAVVKKRGNLKRRDIDLARQRAREVEEYYASVDR